MATHRRCGLRLAATLLVSALTASAVAQQGLAQDAATAPERRYAVEIILFRYADSVSPGTEVFLPDPPQYPPYAEDPVDVADGDRDSAIPGGEERDTDVGPSFGDGRMDGDSEPVELDQVALEVEEVVTRAASIDLRVMPPEDRVMAAEHERLLMLDAYQPVLWSGWTQTVRDEASSPSVNLRRLGRLPLEFDGELTLYLGRFVHLVVDVELQAPGVSIPQPEDRVFGERRRRGEQTSSQDRFGASPVHYRIHEDQIMRSGDYRYFDHPKFGLLARLSLVEEQEEDSQDAVFDDSADLLPGAAGDEAGTGASATN